MHVHLGNIIGINLLKSNGEQIKHWRWFIVIDVDHYELLHLEWQITS